MDINNHLKQNPELVINRGKAKAFFSDIFLNDQAKINVMLNAYDLGIIDELSNSTGFSKAKITKELTTKYAVRDEMAVWAVEEWIKLLTPEVVEAIEPIRINEEEQQIESSNETEIEIGSVETLDIEAIKDEYDNYYVNPYHTEDSRVYVPCGFGKTDNGFFICGIKKKNICNHKNASIYAIIYNYLIRNSRMTEEDVPEFLKKQEVLYELDYKSIYRLCILILQLIRHNYIKDDNVNLNYDGEIENLKYAISVINGYAKLFCGIIGIEPVTLRVINSKGGIKISLLSDGGIHIVNNNEIVSNAREIWYGRKINYNLDIDNPDVKEKLEYLLKEISPFKSFKEGQLIALSSMLSSKRHAVCIMPTGSGKSLIYYMAAILQPLPIFVISPTDILIRDQIRNLSKFHRIDNVAHLKLEGEKMFMNYTIQCNINFLTPMTFQNGRLLSSFKYINNGSQFIPVGRDRNGVIMREVTKAQGPLVAYVVLDEIHCISNWGHDFRPEYLMLSNYLNKLLDRISFWGFTATANYTVVEDIQKQLEIEQKSIYSPITFDKYNVTYDYRILANEKAMYDELENTVKGFISSGERTLVFTKNADIARQAADVIGWEADLFDADNPESYYQFVEGKCKVLVANEELGVGINLPNVRNVVHFGLPLSKNEYVQEIGRAGRENGRVKSVILFLSEDDQNVPRALLRRDAPISELSVAMKEFSNDYKEVFKKITNNCSTQEAMYNKLTSYCSELGAGGDVVRYETYKRADATEKKQLLYMLYVTGFVRDWNVYNYMEDDCVGIYIDIRNTSHKDPIILRMKNTSKRHFEFLGNNRECIVKVDRAQSREEIFNVYIEWYYSQYLYRHKEEFLDFYEFVKRNINGDIDRIAEEIQDYFILPFAQMKQDESYYQGLSINELREKIIHGISKKKLANIERINTNNYSHKLDLLLMCMNLKMNDLFERDRFNRIVSNTDQSERKEIVQILEELYSSCNTDNKIKLINSIDDLESELRCSANEYLSRVYSTGEKDIVYYGIIAEELNKSFESYRR